MYVHGSHSGRVTKGPLYELMPSLPKKIPNDITHWLAEVSQRKEFSKILIIYEYMYIVSGQGQTPTPGVRLSIT